MATTYTNMGLNAWNAGADYFSYTQLDANWAAIDAHDHSSGKGIQVPTGGIANNAITTAKILDSAVTSAKIADASIQGVDIGAGQIGVSKISAEAWTSFTPAVQGTSITLGTGGYIKGRYIKSGKIVYAQGQFYLGTGGALVGTNIAVELSPYPSINVSQPLYQIGTVVAYQSPNTRTGFIQVNFNSQYGSLFAFNGTNEVQVTATAPWTWASGAYCNWAVTYEAN